MQEANKHIIIQGIRGIPAAHGGFETFAEHLSLHLVERDWEVTVYCQSASAKGVEIKNWEGVRLIHIPERMANKLGTIIFDLESIMHSLRYRGVFLTLGYNTAIFNILYKIFKKPNIINMDGIEWKRAKWGFIAKQWFKFNEFIAMRVADKLVADHPEICSYLTRKRPRSKISTIPYGACHETIDESVLVQYGLKSECYFLVVARPEPENSILEIVNAFVRVETNKKLVLLGNFESDNDYHQSVIRASNKNVVFLGAIYDQKSVSSLRSLATAYIHGHTVGGTNPSLIEAMAASSFIICHDNSYNSWVAGRSAVYFKDIDELTKIFIKLDRKEIKTSDMRVSARKRFTDEFNLKKINEMYENLLLDYVK